MDELLRPPAEETKRRWKRLESDLANKLEGWLTVGSGNKSDKGDAKSYLFLGECKYRWAWGEPHGFYMPLDMQWLEAIWRHAQPKEKVPLLALEWGDGSRACMMPRETYLEQVNSPLGPILELSSRIPTVPVRFAHKTTLIDFGCIEIPQYLWVLFPWADLSWLRREELEERKRLGKQSVSRLKGGRPLPKTPFPTKRKK